MNPNPDHEDMSNSVIDNLRNSLQNEPNLDTNDVVEVNDIMDIDNDI